MLRIYAAKHRWAYIRSFNGLVDLFTVLPLILASPHGTVALRLLRLLRLVKITTFFPVLKTLFVSISGALNLIGAVLGTIALLSLLVGNLVFIAEPDTFGNAFQGLWWSLVTMSTVGYGDFVPHTVMGKVLGGFLILTGILMFAMVTAVISVRVGRMVHMSSKCIHCDEAISPEYDFCPFCGENQAEDIQLF
jgi:voltage-gated potassium channel